MRMLLMAGVACLATLVLNGACVAAEHPSTKAPRAVMNVVNFVRALDPRQPRAWYAEALREEVALNRKYKLKNTILFQYDALIDPELRTEAAKSDLALTEFGLWFEMSRPLNEAAGLPNVFWGQTL